MHENEMKLHLARWLRFKQIAFESISRVEHLKIVNISTFHVIKLNSDENKMKLFVTSNVQ